MKIADQKRALAAAVTAARAAGTLMRRNLRATKRVNESTQHDIKLELDVRCQKLIERTLARSFPDIPVLGEEGDRGDTELERRWVVDPIDGTVNFSYGIPHACVSIALQVAKASTKYKRKGAPTHATVIGVVYDPFTDELWTAIKGQRARLNGRPIRVSSHAKLNEAIVSIGFAKSRETIERTLPFFNKLVRRVRKVRMMGAAALALTYVATGRFDGYIESGIRLWDIAAGGLIVECAGGEFWSEPTGAPHTYRMIATNGRLRRQLQALRSAVQADGPTSL